MIVSSLKFSQALLRIENIFILHDDVLSHGTADNFLLDSEGNKTWNIESLVTEVVPAPAAIFPFSFLYGCSYHCVTGPEIFTGTGTKAGTRNMMGTGPEPKTGTRFGPAMGLGPGKGQSLGPGPRMGQEQKQLHC